jgi:hypothetical protein
LFGLELLVVDGLIGRVSVESVEEFEGPFVILKFVVLFAWLVLEVELGVIVGFVFVALLTEFMPVTGSGIQSPLIARL